MPTILLADDSITIQKIVNLTFSGEGIDVVTVGNGDAAVKKIHELRPALVLADIFMPGKNGYEVCDYIKTEPSLNTIPVILLVGAFEPFDSNEAARVKADGHLTKPFEIKVLISAVNSLITATSGPRDAVEAAEEPVVSEAAEAATSAVDQTTVPAFEPLPEIPAASRLAEAEATSEWSTPQPAILEPQPALALGVEMAELGLSQPVVAEPVVDPVSPVAELAEQPVEKQLPSPQFISPSLMIEESDPLGLLSADTGLSTDSEIALDARSMVVDIWEPRVAIEAPVPAATPEPVVVPAEERTSQMPATTDSAVDEIPIAEPPARESITEAAQDEPRASEPMMPLAEPAVEHSEATAAPTAVSEELIERIANRVVEKLSREVIERIAWEVVPDLAELMIKEHVETHLKESQPR